MSTRLQRTFGTATNNKIFTVSVWVKKQKVGFTHVLLEGSGVSHGRPSPQLLLNSSGRLILDSYNGSDYDVRLHSTRLFRDLNGWYHVVMAVDTTQATASNRVKFYVNGEQITDFESGLESYPSQNLVLSMNHSTHHVIGGSANAGFSGGNEHCIMSHYHLTDGTTYDASAFGETDSTTGEWKIKTSPSVTYGNNGFFILKDGNSVTDQSGNSNNWTVGQGTLTKTEDNPSNVFATLNPLATSTTSGSFSNGNTTHAKSNSTWASTTSTLAASSGKYYAEYKFTANSSSSNGQMAAIVNMDLTNYMNENSDLEQNGNKGITYYANGTVFADNQQTVATYSSYGDAIIQIAMDLDNGFLYFGKDGTWQNSGVPTSGSTGTGGINISNYIGAGTYAFGLANRNTGATSVNFGNGYFGTTAVSSAGTNASGNGIFEYDVPTGYTALSTKGLNL